MQWKLVITMEYTGKGTPEMIQLAKCGFSDIAGKVRVMMVKAKLPEEIKYKLCKEHFSCAMYLSNLAVVTLNGMTATRYKHFIEAKPCFAKHLRIWREASTVSTGKVETMIFIGYAKNHARDCYCIYNPTTEFMTEMRDIRDITWMHHMYYGYPVAIDEVKVYL